MLDAFAEAVEPHLPATSLPTHVKLVRFVIGLLGVSVAIFGCASVLGAGSGESHGAGLSVTFWFVPMAFAGSWLSAAAAPFGVISAIVGWRLTMAASRLRAAAAVCLGWAVVSLFVSVASPDSRVLAAVAMTLMAGSMLNVARQPRDRVLAARRRGRQA